MEILGNDGGYNETELRWSEVPSIDENGKRVFSPEELIALEESEPGKPGIRRQDPPELIG